MSPPGHKEQPSEMEMQELRERFTVLEAGLVDIKSSVDRVTTALLGDELGNQGLVHRVEVSESKIASHERKFVQWGAYIVCAGFILGSLAKLLHII